ncbi:MAG: hypothetical protein WCC93_14240, partial [Chthoniobacterales bacterium]
MHDVAGLEFPTQLARISVQRIEISVAAISGSEHRTRPLTGSESEILMMHTNRKTSGDGLVKQGQAERRHQDRRGRQSRAEISTRDYAALVAVFNGLLATALFARKCSREPLPERVEPKDLALFALATQKLS